MFRQAFKSACALALAAMVLAGLALPALPATSTDTMGTRAHTGYDRAPGDVDDAAAPQLDHIIYLPFTVARPVPPSNEETPSPVVIGPGDFGAGIESWMIQLSGYPDGRLNEIATSDFDLVVVDMGPNARHDFDPDDIAAVQDTGKTVLAYVQIGAIEEFRRESDGLPDDLRLGPVSDAPETEYVKYWDERWWDDVVQRRLSRVLASGFDGVYLDMIATYAEIPADSAGTDRDDLAQKMVDLITRVANYAQQRDPDFRIVPQNAPELWGYPGYLDAIDGLGQESLYFLPMDAPCDAAWCAEAEKNAAAIRAQGKPVFTVDYAAGQSAIDSAYQQAQAQGFVPYVTDTALDVMRINPGWPPDPNATPVPSPIETPPAPTPVPTDPPPTQAPPTPTPEPTATLEPTATPPPPTPEPTAPPPAPSGTLIINHDDVNPTDADFAAAEQVRALFVHKSVGNNILDGLAAIGFNRANLDNRQVGSNYYPLTKIEGFDELVRGGTWEAAFLKFCPGDLVPDYATMSGAQIWDAYRSAMEALMRDESEHLVWWTFPLDEAGRGAEDRAAFNSAVRSYVAEHGGTLFDIADMQSNGGQCQADGYEALCSEWTDDGGHLNTAGSAYVARGFVVMLSRIAQMTGTAE